MTAARLQPARTHLALPRLIAVTLIGGIVAAAVAAQICPTLAELLQYDRGAIAAGQYWRLLTGHLTHWSWDHLLWDALMFVVCAGWCMRWDRLRTLHCLLASAAAISIALALTMPKLAIYRGLSGIDSALFVLLCLLAFRQHRGRAVACLAIVGLTAFAAKTSIELLTGRCLFVDAAAAGFAPVPLAHAVGAIVAVLVIIASDMVVRFTAARDRPLHRATVQSTST